MPVKYEIIIGDKNNRLTILNETKPYYTSGGNKKRMVTVQCECGTIKDIRLEQFRSGSTKSCGCYNLEKAGETLITHNLSGTRLYSIWKDMRRRCNNPNRKNYIYYGGRGIKVCDEWNNSYVPFYEWSIINGYSDELSIERVNNNGDYEPSNCKWITTSEQKSNTRQQKPFKAISPDGKEYIETVITHFANKHGLERRGISACLNNRQDSHRGWTFKILTNQ